MATRFLFETKCGSRVKGVAFHPVLPWICASTYVGLIHVWDYETNREIHRFRHPHSTKHGHNSPLLESSITFGDSDGDGDVDGRADTNLPVRCVDFHSKDPLIVSAGDDLNIKLWDCRLRHCLLTFSGHADYIRTVRFHPKTDQANDNAKHNPSSLPWILSASDDKTIRIWNYIKRTCLCVIDKGHTDYIMSAEFHPTLDLILTASLDHTVRVWDTTRLTQMETTVTDQNIAPHDDHHTHNFTYNHNDYHNSAPTSSSHPKSVTLKFVLEGHRHGVNWAAFHPSLPIIASASDDCRVKIWKFSDDRAWEDGTQLTRRHDRNVTSCLFATAASTTTIDTSLAPKPTPSQIPLIVSCSEDGRVCIWDINDETCIGAFRRNSRFWVLSKHPTNNIMAAGHDSGLIMFKLDREDSLERSHRFQHDFELTQDTTTSTVRSFLQEILTRIHYLRPKSPFIFISSLIAWILVLVLISFLPSPFFHFLVIFGVGFISLLRDDQSGKYQTFFMSCWIFGGLGMFASRPVAFLIALVVLSFIAHMFCKWRSASNFVNRELSITEETCGDIIDTSEEIKLYPM